MNDWPFHKLLPVEVQQELRRAAATQNTREDPQARAKAIDRVRRKNPKHFK